MMHSFSSPEEKQRLLQAIKEIMAAAEDGTLMYVVIHTGNAAQVVAPDDMCFACVGENMVEMGQTLRSVGHADDKMTGQPTEPIVKPDKPVSTTLADMPSPSDYKN